MPAPEGNKFAEGCEESGRPSKYNESYNEQARKLCLLGATDDDLADFFGVHRDTIYEWKRVHEEFSDSIQAGKMIADMEVAESLYKGTQDRRVVEQQAFKVKVGQFEEKVQIVDVEKVIPADFRNQQFWLKNRRAKDWRDRQELDHTTNGKDIPSGVPDYKNMTSEQLRDILASRGRAD